MFLWLCRVFVEGVLEFKTVHSKDHPNEVAVSLSAYDSVQPANPGQLPDCFQTL